MVRDRLTLMPQLYHGRLLGASKTARHAYTYICRVACVGVIQFDVETWLGVL